jgi:hypothetical protein
MRGYTECPGCNHEVRWDGERRSVVEKASRARIRIVAVAAILDRERDWRRESTIRGAILHHKPLVRCIDEDLTRRAMIGGDIRIRVPPKLHLNRHS